MHSRVYTVQTFFFVPGESAAFCEGRSFNKVVGELKGLL